MIEDRIQELLSQKKEKLSINIMKAIWKDQVLPNKVHSVWVTIDSALLRLNPELAVMLKIAEIMAIYTVIIKASKDNCLSDLTPKYE